MIVFIWQNLKLVSHLLSVEGDTHLVPNESVACELQYYKHSVIKLWL